MAAQTEKILISIVSPVYLAEDTIEELVLQLEKEVTKISPHYEIILVEDGSPDGSWKKIESICAVNSRVKGIKLSKNFGQHYAITAGLDQTKGEWVVVMDCDLQDRPAEISGLYAKCREGYDVVLAKRQERTDNLVKKSSSVLFYKTLSILTGIKMDHSIANFGIYHRNVIDAVCKLREPIRYFPTMIRWVGFKQTYLSVQHGSRFSGETSYNWNKLLRLALDIILANSDKPLRMIVKVGFLIAAISFIIGLIIMFRYLSGFITVPGYTSLLVSMWFLGGVVLFVLGLIGLYIGKIFEGVKNRPIYIASKMINFNG